MFSVTGPVMSSPSAWPEDAPALLVQRRGQTERLSPKDEVLARPGPEPVVPAVDDRSLRARLDTCGAEEAAPQVEPQSPTVAPDGVGRTRVDTGRATGATLRLIEPGAAPEPVRQQGLRVRVRDRPMPLPQARDDRLQHDRASEVMATVRQVEALVAERKVGDLLPAERDREAHPVVEGRIHDLVARQAPATVGHGHVTDLSAPSLDEPDHQPVRPSGPERGARRPIG